MRSCTQRRAISRPTEHEQLARAFPWRAAECRGQRLNPWCAFLFAGLGRKVVGEWLQHWPYFKDAVALASPIKPTDEAWNRVVVLGDKALRGFCDGWQGGFAELGNMDLYRGEVADDRR